MDKFVPFEKMSKKKQREINAKKRGSWYGINPVTRKPENSKAYNRRKARKWSDEFQDRAFYMVKYLFRKSSSFHAVSTRSTRMSTKIIVVPDAA